MRESFSILFPAVSWSRRSGRCRQHSVVGLDHNGTEDPAGRWSTFGMILCPELGFRRRPRCPWLLGGPILMKVRGGATALFGQADESWRSNRSRPGD
jgi:hypothetical protein